MNERTDLGKLRFYKYVYHHLNMYASIDYGRRNPVLYYNNQYFMIVFQEKEVHGVIMPCFPYSVYRFLYPGKEYLIKSPHKMSLEDIDNIVLPLSRVRGVLPGVFGSSDYRFVKVDEIVRNDSMCYWCGKPFVQSGKNRPRKYCPGSSCRYNMKNFKKQYLKLQKENRIPADLDFEYMSEHWRIMGKPGEDMRKSVIEELNRVCANCGKPIELDMRIGAKLCRDCERNHRDEYYNRLKKEKRNRDKN